LYNDGNISDMQAKLKVSYEDLLQKIFSLPAFVK